MFPHNVVARGTGTDWVWVCFVCTALLVLVLRRFARCTRACSAELSVVSSKCILRWIYSKILDVAGGDGVDCCCGCSEAGGPGDWWWYI